MALVISFFVSFISYPAAWCCGHSTSLGLNPGQLLNACFEAFTAVMFQVKVFWGVTPCTVVVGYQRFSGPCCLHLHGVTASQLRIPRLEVPA